MRRKVGIRLVAAVVEPVVHREKDRHVANYHRLEVFAVGWVAFARDPADSCSHLTICVTV